MQIHKQREDQAIFNVKQASDVNIDPRDEVQTFRAGRYVSSNEAAWRIFGYHYTRDTPLSPT